MSREKSDDRYKNETDKGFGNSFERKRKRTGERLLAAKSNE